MASKIRSRPADVVTSRRAPALEERLMTSDRPNVVSLADWTASHTPRHDRDTEPPGVSDRLPYALFDFELWTAWQRARSRAAERGRLTPTPDITSIS